MAKKTDKSGNGKLSPQEREALAEELFEKATDHTKRNHDDPEESDPVKLLEKAIELYQKPKYYYVKVHHLLWEYEMLDEIEEAEVWLNTSPYKMPVNSETDYSEKYMKLFELTSKALELDPEYSQAHYMNARIHNQLGEYSQALAEINRALSMRQKLYLYYDTLHEILINLGDLQGALIAINKAFELKPDGYRLTEHKYELLLIMGRYQEALDFLKTFFVKENEDPLVIYFNLSIPLLLKMKDHERSLDVLLEVIKLSIGTSQFNDLLTDLYKQGEYRLLARLPLGKNKKTLKVLWLLFWANIHSGDFAQARNFLVALDLNKDLTTELQDYETIELDDIPDATQLPRSTYEENVSWNSSKQEHYSISKLFSLAQPYEKVPMDIFLLLLRKIFNGRYAKQYFHEILGKFKQKWDTEPELISQWTTYGEQYYDISLKIMLLGDVARFVHKLNKKKAVLFSLLQHAMNTSLMGAMNSIMLKVQLDERNRILANLSHSVKGIVKSVIDPLESLRKQVPQKEPIIANAIKGANQIREIVNAVNFSLKTVFEELQWDIRNPGQDSISLGEMILDSLKYSISNMFDFRYFQVYAESYFPSKLSPKEFDRIKAEWGQVASEVSIEGVIDFANRNLFRLETNLDASQNFRAGNEKSSAAKLRILFQEIIFNAVKYASFVSAGARMVAITLVEKGDDLKLEVKNSYSPQVHAKTTGVGKIVIENFAKVLNCQPEVKTDGTTYSLTIEFNNIWRNHAKDPLH